MWSLEGDTSHLLHSARTLLLVTCTSSDRKPFAPPGKVFCMETVPTVASRRKRQENSPSWATASRRLGAAFFLYHQPCMGWGPTRLLLACACSLVTKGFGNRKPGPRWPISSLQICRSDNSVETFVPTRLEGTAQVKSCLEAPSLLTAQELPGCPNSPGSQGFYSSTTCTTDAVRTHGSSKYSKYSHASQCRFHCS